MKIPKNLRIQAKFLLLLVFLTSLLSSCTNEYFVYHQKQESFSQNQKEQKENVANWSPESVEKTEISVFTSPEQSSLDRVIRRITEAKKRVDIEVYMLSEKRIIDALKEAKMRGVIIRVILEPNPYGNPYINKKTFATLEKAEIPVVWADGKRYVFTHAKFMLVDDVYIVMTANMTHSAFVTNREFFCEGKDASIFQVLSDIFEADFAHEPIALSHPNLVIAPLDARGKLENLIKSAKKNILIYAETFDDDRLFELLKKKVESHVQITINITSPKKIAQNQKNVDMFKSLGMKVFTPKKPTIHAKVIVVDDSVAYIGSENFTTNSLERNREIGIITKDTSAISVILEASHMDKK